MNNNTHYIFFTGGVSSSLGKGVTASALACLLIARGYKVRLRKFDPYINVDAGTISPLQHGEVYVTDDGGETDLDLGHYERLTGQRTTGEDNFTTGRIYQNLINRERQGKFLGQTVQVIPHVTDTIQDIITDPEINKDIDFSIIEIGGTVGDIEGLPYIEAIRQLRYRLGKDRVLFMHMTWIPYLSAAGEYKTKPTQHGVKELLKLGINPDVLVCRSDSMLKQSSIDKISMLCSIDTDNIISVYDVCSIYLIPKLLHEQHLDTIVLSHFKLPSYQKSAPTKKDDQDLQHTLDRYEDFAEQLLHNKTKLKVAIVGKYTSLGDSYLSVIESLRHAAVANHVGVDIALINAADLEDMSKLSLKELFHDIDAVVIPGGYGQRASEGKIIALEYARVNNLPTLAICLGMQLMVIELCRHILKLPHATSTEFDSDTKYPVVINLDKWRRSYHAKYKIPQEYLHKNFLGETMRLGSYACHLKEDTLIAKIYGSLEVYERHRHRYEINDVYLKKLESEKVLVVSGVNQDTDVAEVVELPQCSYFIGCQYHPEFKSSFRSAHPLFVNLLKVALDEKISP